MDDVLDSQENEGLRPLKLNRLRRNDRLLFPMVDCESDMAARPNSPSMFAISPHPGGVGGTWLETAVAASVCMRSSGVIGGSDMVPDSNSIDYITALRRCATSRVVTEIDAFTLGPGDLKNRVITHEHGNERETERDDEQNRRIRERRRPTEEARPVWRLVLVPTKEIEK